jgi:dUTP pyrophosphatase
MKLPYMRLNKMASTPAYQTDGAACFDLSFAGEEPVVLYPRNIQIVGTGLAFEVPTGHVLKVFVRSSMGFKHGVTLANGTGIIDSDYRGEIKLALINLGAANVLLHPGDRVAQAMLAPAPQAELLEVAALTSTARGAGGFGSTGRA